MTINFLSFEGYLFFGILVVAFLFIIIYITRLKKCPSDKIMVIYGLLGKTKDGQVISCRCFHGGAYFIWPFIQNYQFLDLSPLSISIEFKNLLIKQNTLDNIISRFTVGISTEPEIMKNAAERLLALSRDEIIDLAKNIITGQLLLVIADVDEDDIYKNATEYTKKISFNVENEIKNVGLRLINLNLSKKNL